MSSKTRKYDSVYEKTKKKKRIEELTHSHKGALDKFIVKDGSSNDNVNMDEDIDKVDDNVPSVDEMSPHNCDIPTKNRPLGLITFDQEYDQHLSPIENVENEDVNEHPVPFEENVDISLTCDIYDPRNWDNLDAGLIDILAVKGPKRNLSIENGPKDKGNRHFSARGSTRILSNGEKWERE
ncbi:hypothetical protein RND81_02G186400 [Saponaria officinalis]|uniref:Uncharacterized protein n=1 Tax=Saponaria officinalis TaxID=3572 RepID=A0AAW1MVF1_SAPOF